MKPDHLAFAEKIDGALIGIALTLLAVVSGVLVRFSKMFGAILLLGFEYWARRWLRNKGVPDEEIDEALKDGS